MKKFILILLCLLHFSSQAQTKGYADLHVHMFANLGFAGGWFIGDPGIDQYEKLFNQCKAGESWPWLKGFIEKFDPYVSSFLYREHCVPQNIPFPAWNDLAHQQVWKNDLRKAKDDGLSLMVMSAVHSYVLCRILPDSRKNFDNCDDYPNLMRELKAAREFIENQEWVELALTPMDARRIIEEGKLAVVLAIESSNNFETDDWQKEFDSFWEIGVRSIQLVHQFDNTLAGAAIHKKPLKFAQYIRNWMRYNKLEGFDSFEEEYPTKFGVRHVIKNKKGLTEKGKAFVKYMMEKGMPIDFAHMSEQTMKDTMQILDEKRYPFFFSHGHFRDTMKGGLGEFEKSTSIEMLNHLKRVDGVFGLRTFTFGTHTFYPQFQNNCDGSTLSFAQALQFGNDLGINIAFGSDLNGFIPQTRPRFSNTDSNYCPEQKTAKLESDFDVTGLGKISQLKDMLHDLKNIGVDTSNIEHSADKFIQVWEKSLSSRN